MNITNYRGNSMQEVTDPLAAKMADYDEYARRCVVEQLQNIINKEISNAFMEKGLEYATKR